MIVDPAVSRHKFAREVEAAKAYSPFQRQGVWIMRAEYPVVFVVLVTNQLVPVLPGVLCGVHLDFSDYDVRPPSLRFVDPFDEKPLSASACWGFPKVSEIVNPETGETVHEVQKLLQHSIQKNHSSAFKECANTMNALPTQATPGFCIVNPTCLYIY